MAHLLYTTLELDRAHRRRRDPERLAAMAADPAAAVVPLWRDATLLAGEPPRAVLAEGEAAARLLAESDSVFLGLDGARPLFLVDLPDRDEGEEGPDLGLGGAWMSLRSNGPVLPAGDGTLLAYARGLALWHRNHRFCGRCGAATLAVEAGHLRRCSRPACGAESYPRTDPAVIMLVEDADRVLLHRQRIWPPGMWSCLAGFVEPGETLEQAVIREVEEESGILAGDVRYVASQPWPFPASLMVAFTARAVGGALAPDFDEVEDARWFSRAEFGQFDDRHRRDGGGLFLAYPGTAARHLIEGWLGRGR